MDPPVINIFFRTSSDSEDGCINGRFTEIAVEALS